jgi:hypothetical protein
MPFWVKKKLIDYDPKELDLATLSHLRASLMAKLLIVNRELSGRYTGLMEASIGLENTEDTRKTFEDFIVRIKTLNNRLEDELSRGLSK